MELLDFITMCIILLQVLLSMTRLEVIKFVIPRLEKNAILLVDDYNLINQEGVKWAVRDAGINIEKGIQTQSGQLIFYT